MGYQPRAGYRLLQDIQDRSSVFEMAGQFLFADRIIYLDSHFASDRSAFACRNLNLVRHDDNLTSTSLRLFNTAQLVVLAYTVYFWLITCRVPPNYPLLGTLKRYERIYTYFFSLGLMTICRSMVPSYLTVSDHRRSTPGPVD